MVLNGTMAVGVTDMDAGRVSFAENQVVGGSGTVVFGPRGPDSLLLPNDNTTRVIGLGVTIRGQNGFIGTEGVKAAVVNQQTIRADVIRLSFSDRIDLVETYE
jgi:hypothetical protein